MNGETILEFIKETQALLLLAALMGGTLLYYTRQNNSRYSFKENKRKRESRIRIRKAGSLHILIALAVLSDQYRAYIIGVILILTIPQILKMMLLAWQRSNPEKFLKPHTDEYRRIILARKLESKPKKGIKRTKYDRRKPLTKFLQLKNCPTCKDARECAKCDGIYKSGHHGLSRDEIKTIEETLYNPKNPPGYGSMRLWTCLACGAKHPMGGCEP